MTIEVGDIVQIESGLRWLVVNFTSPPYEGYAQLLCYQNNGQRKTIIKAPVNLILVERPVFKREQKVNVDGLRGTLLGIENAVARVLIPERMKPTVGGMKLILDACIVRVPFPALVMENRKIWKEMNDGT